MKNFLIGVGVVFGILFVFMLLTVGVVSAANKPKGDKEEVLPGKKGNSKKALIIYHPGISKFTTRMTHQLAKGLNEGGYEVTLNHPGDHLSTDLSGYTLVVFGSPTYAGQISSAMRKYMARACPQIANTLTMGIVLFSTGALDEIQEFDKLEEMLVGLNVVKKVKFLAGSKTENDKTAYDLGIELVKE
jgi:flavorubredoxin